jgi:hypothetical protein
MEAALVRALCVLDCNVCSVLRDPDLNMLLGGDKLNPVQDTPKRP